MTLGDVLQHYRKKAGLTGNEASRRSRLNRNTIYRLENDSGKTPVALLDKLAPVYKTTVSEIIRTWEQGLPQIPYHEFVRDTFLKAGAPQKGPSYCKHCHLDLEKYLPHSICPALDRRIGDRRREVEP